MGTWNGTIRLEDLSGQVGFNLERGNYYEVDNALKYINQAMNKSAVFKSEKFSKFL